MQKFINLLHHGAFSARVRVPLTVRLLTRKGGVPITFLRALFYRTIMIMKGSDASLVRISYRFIATIVKLVRVHGELLTVKYLKASHVALMRYVGRDPVRSLREIEPDLPLMRTINGLPALIPVAHRRAIRALKYGNKETGGVFYTRFWLTMFGVYRVLSLSKNVVKYGPITGSPTFGPEWLQLVKFFPLFVRWASDWAPELRKGARVDISSDDPTAGGSTKSGPNASNQWRGLSIDAVAWLKGCPESFRYVFKRYLNVTGSVGLWPSLMKEAYAALKAGGFRKWRFPDPMQSTPSGPRMNNWTILRLGKLANKIEPAGKVRVFAIADAWTQAALKPLHSFLFGALSKCPTDGTFNQDAALDEIAPQADKAWSYDLSSATDRLPVFLQGMLLNHLIPASKLPKVSSGPSLGEIWTSLLVDRPWIISGLDLPVGSDDPIGDKTDWSEHDYVLYKTGQPMGAYSSWAMLAWFHHAVVQYCWFLEGGTSWFMDYRVVGDDLTIINHPGVAANYQKTIYQLGAEIGLAKSIVSPSGVIEFIKRFVWKTLDLSGLPLKMLISGVSLTNRLGTLSFLHKRGWVTTTGGAIRVVAIGRREVTSLQNLGWGTQSRRLLALLQATRLNSADLVGSIEGLLASPLVWAPKTLDQWLRPKDKAPPRVSATRMKIERALMARLFDVTLKFLDSVPYFRGVQSQQGGYLTATQVALLVKSSELRRILTQTPPKEWAALGYEGTRKLLKPYLSGIWEMLSRESTKEFTVIDNLSALRWLYKEFKLARTMSMVRVPKTKGGPKAGRQFGYLPTVRLDSRRKRQGNLRAKKG